MNNNRLVYHLIGSLSKAEKRYVSRYAAFNRDKSRLLKLFNFINEHGITGDEDLRKSNKNATLLRDLEVSKVHLTQLILVSLRQYHRQEGGERRLRGLMDDADLLWRKSQYQACAQTLKKIKRLAKSLGYYTYVLEAVYMERNMMGTHPAFPLTEETVDIANREEKEALEALQTEFKFRNLAARSAIIHKRFGNSRSETDFAEITALAAMPEYDVSEATTLRSKRFYHHSMLTYYSSIGNLERAVMHNREILETYNAPELIREHAAGFIIAHNNQALLHLRLKQYKSALEILEALPLQLKSAIRRPNRELQWRVQVARLNYSLGICLECGDMHRAKPLILEAEDFIARFARTISVMRLSEMRFSIASYYLINNQPDKALEYLSAVEQTDYVRQKHDLYISVRIMQLIAHYELGNTLLLPYLVRSLYHAVMSRERLFRFESVLIGFMRKDLLKIVDKRSAQRSFKKLHATFEVLYNDPLEQHAFINFDILSWLDSKIRNISFTQAIYEKHGHLLV